MSMPFAMPFGQPAGFAPAFSAPEPRPRESLWLVFRGTEILVAESSASADVPTADHPRSLGLEPERELYLGMLDQAHCFAAQVSAASEAPGGWAFRGVRSLFGVAEDGLVALAGRALQLVEWDRTHRFCGACGTPTATRTTERSRECPACGMVLYPRLAPVVMCLVRRGDEFLLARSPRFPKAVFSALAGFVEPGETLEQCVAREVHEEVGIKVKNLRYFASQPWPFPHSLMIAFFAEHAGGEIQVDGVEIEAAQWFNAGNLPQLPAKISIARKLIDAALLEMNRAAMGETAQQRPLRS